MPPHISPFLLWYCLRSTGYGSFVLGIFLSHLCLIIQAFLLRYRLWSTGCVLLSSPDIIQGAGVFRSIPLYSKIALARSRYIFVLFMPAHISLFIRDHPLSTGCVPSSSPDIIRGVFRSLPMYSKFILATSRWIQGNREEAPR